MSKTSLKNEIYDLEEQYRRNLERLANDRQISQENKEMIKEYVQDRLALRITKTRAVMLIANLRRSAQITNKPFNELQEKDVKQIMIALESKSYSEWTKVTTKKILKAFLRSIEKPESILKWITCETPQNKIRAEDLLSEHEMSSMVAAADSPMWKAMLAILFETGVRPGELLLLQIKDVVLNEFKARIYVSGKTEKQHGERPVYVYQKTYSLLKAWLSIHPQRSNPEAPLWLAKKNKPLRQGNFGNIYKRISKNAGITRKNTPYRIRHTRLTQVYRDYGTAIGAKIAGHVAGSKEVRTYLHLSETDVEEALDASHGLKEQKKKEDAQKCPKCQLVNPYGEIICTSCHSALNSAGAVIVESERQEELKEIQELKGLIADPQIISILQSLKNPEVIAAIKKEINK